MNRFWILAGTAVLAGCCLFEGDSRMDTDGFVWTSGGDAPLKAVGDNYIIRYELVTTNRYEQQWMNRLPLKWDFVELRQLHGVATEIRDGVRRKLNGFWPGCNWRQWVDYGARNVRVKFVADDYDPAKDGIEQPPEGFVALFNGKDLTGWKGIVREDGYERPATRRQLKGERLRKCEAKGLKAMREHWSVQDGVLTFDGLPGGYNIAAAKQYGDFEVIADWRLLRVCGDSGFYLRGMPQVQIWDPNMWDGLGSGSIWNNTNEPFAPLARADHPIGSWNRCRMKIVGDRVWVWLNGVMTVDGIRYENADNPREPIPAVDNFELQCHGDPIQFRNLFIREL